MMKIFYAQSGGVTSVINTTLAYLVRSAREQGWEVCLGICGIKGLLRDEWVAASTLSEVDLQQIAATPGGSFGSCRYRISEQETALLCDKIVAHQFDAVIYQGGNDSQLTLLKISQELQSRGLEVPCLGLPKTIDNDLPETDFCPGFLSSAQFLMRGIRQACLDVQSMCEDSTKVFIVETMGRHTGWLTASCGLMHEELFPGPQILLVPEIRQPLEMIAEKINSVVSEDGFCAIAISEGYAPDSGTMSDAFGHKQLEGSGMFLKQYAQSQLELKTRLCVPDYFQRSFMATASSLDLEVSAALGKAAIELLQHQAGSGQMLTISYDFCASKWGLSQCPLENIAGKERPVPREFFDELGWGLSPSGRHYFKTLCSDLHTDRTLPGLQLFWPHFLRQKKAHSQSHQLPTDELQDR